jgi:hypothetical protein
MTEPSTDIDTDDAPPPVPGRGRRGARTRTSEARSLPRGQAVGRDGEVLVRAVTTLGDQFEIPPHLKERGWDYQWLSEKILNNADVVRRHNHQMYQTGWRPVAAIGKWNGVFGPISDTGHIIVSDMGLYERPASLTEEAKAEDYKKAVGQMRDRDEALMGGKAKLRDNVRDGIAMGGKYRGTGGDIRMSIDPALDVERPSYQPADDDAS